MKAVLLTGRMVGRRCCGMAMHRTQCQRPMRSSFDVHAAEASTPRTTRCGWVGQRLHSLRFPHILGRDFSGVVAKTGEAA